MSNHQLTADFEDVLADHRRLVRELDVAIHGEEGAAQQASLCDLIEPIRRLRTALTKSVKLQSHYAKLLNVYDGGRRLQFSDADAWIERLRVLEQRRSNAPG